MGLETVTNIADLNVLWPLGGDPKAQGDDHLRNIKKAIVTDLGSLAGPLTATAAEVNSFEGRIAALEAAPPDLADFAGMVAGGPAALAEPWLLCDGSSVTEAQWPDLFAIIGADYGGAAGNFNVPDYRGEVLRGTDRGAGRDPDAAARTTRGDGTTGDNVGTRQLDQFKSHQHTDKSSAQTTNIATAANPVRLHEINTLTGATGGNETRGRNVAQDWYIYGGIKVP